MCTILITGVTKNNQNSTIQDLDKTFITPKNKDTSSSIENNAFITNSVNLDAWISPVMDNEL